MLPGFDGVIDLSHHNAHVDFAAIRRGGARGVLFKATQGSSGTDPTFAARLVAARAAGLLVGAYHFGERGNMPAQLSHFLAAVGDAAGLLLAFDFEDWSDASGTYHPAPTLDEAALFMSGLAEATGRKGLLYGGEVLREALGGTPDATLRQYPLWLADYRGTPVLPAGWAQWSLWQYTDGQHGPNSGATQGVVGPCDRSAFNGQEAALAAWWANPV